MVVTDPSPAFEDTVQEIMSLYKSLPPRPSIDEVEAAMSVVKTVDAEEQLKLEEISKMERPKDVPEELFSVLQQLKKTMVLFQGHQQRKEALHLIEAEKIFDTFDGLIQRASGLLSGDTQMEKRIGFDGPVDKIEKEHVITDNSFVRRRDVHDFEKKESVIALVKSSSNKASFFSGEGNTDKMSLMKMAAVIENSANRGAVVLDLKGKLMDQVEWIPVSIGKLKDATEIDLSENRIMALPSSLGGLKTLKKLYIHSNQLINLPDSIGELINLIDLDLHANRFKSLPGSFGKLINLMNLDLSSNKLTHLPETIGSLASLQKLNVEINELEELPYTIGELINLIDLDLHANRLKSLPASFGNLINLMNLDLSSNHLTHLPETIGSLTSLQKLNVETNELEELPYTIGDCSSLKELRVDFNQLRALPEAIGKLEFLEILTLHYNRIKMLPTTMGNLMNLKELDVSFNELEYLPENLCFAVSLKKLNVGNNFADFRALPRSIGNLEMLEELDISDDQIRVLPESFRFLSKLRVFRADETPLEVPPRQVTKLGAQAVVEYMADLVANKDVKTLSLKKKKKKKSTKKGSWFAACFGYPMFRSKTIASMQITEA